MKFFALFLSHTTSSSLIYCYNTQMYEKLKNTQVQEANPMNSIYLNKYLNDECVVSSKVFDFKI